MENKEDSKLSATTIFWTAVLIIVLIILFSSGKNNDGSNNLTTTTEEQTQTNSQQNSYQLKQKQIVPVSIETKSKCADDGRAFAQNYQSKNNAVNAGGYRPVWFDPQYHYDSRLNTCIVYVGYAQEDSETDNFNSNPPHFTAYLTVVGLVFDIYSNEVLLQTILNRVSVDGQNTDTPSDFPFYNDVQNLNGNAFKTQLQTLMSE